MKTGAAGINSHIELTTTTLADCVRIDRTDGVQKAFTAHDVNIEYDSVVYKASSTFMRTVLQNDKDLSVNNMNLDGLIDDEEITVSDLRAQRYDNAEIYFFTINWADKSQGIIKLARGNIGEVTLQGDVYVAELRGLTQRLQDNLLRIVTPDCNAEFGDSRCQFDTDTIKQSGAVDAVTNKRTFTTTGLTVSAVNEFGRGLLTWTSGLNNGLSVELKSNTLAGELTLYLLQVFTIQSGDTFDLIPPCDKRYETCRDTHDNLDNFRGFPHIPGRDELVRVDT